MNGSFSKLLHIQSEGLHSVRAFTILKIEKARPPFENRAFS